MRLRWLRRTRLITAIIIFSLIFIFFVLSPKPVTTKQDNLLLHVEPCIGCPGENGKPVVLNEKERRLHNVTAAMKSDYFNIFVSEKISLWRSIPDVRHPRCKAMNYDPNQLPTASVILVFKDERFSILMRTVYSLILRSPKQNLKEIILVDDQSDLVELKSGLSDYCEKYFGDFVRILRAPKRLGLIQGKNYGARHASGDVVVFLDAHCEANTGWLEPILSRIKENRLAVVCPVIDTIDAQTFEYQGGQLPNSVGGFSWSMFFTWVSIPERLKPISQLITAPIPSPTMAGGLLAADRKAFFEFGGYDDGMEVWGAENLEISFRTWMCGGSVEFIPCSHVGHVFRHGHPYNMTGEKGGKNVNGLNSVRLVEVWLDDYKRFFYQRSKALEFRDEDLSDRLELRKRLKCKDFAWYLKNVFPEKLIPDENVIAHGTIKNAATGLCFDTLGKTNHGFYLSVFPWQSGGSGNQYFSFYNDNRICVEESCLNLRISSGIARSGDQVSFTAPENGAEWSYTEAGQLMYKKISVGDLCVSVQDVQASKPLCVRKCDEKDKLQKWILENYIVLK